MLMALTADRSSPLPAGPSTVTCHSWHWPPCGENGTQPAKVSFFRQRARRAYGKEVRSSILDLYCLCFLTFIGDVRQPPLQHLMRCPFCTGAWQALQHGRACRGSAGGLCTNVPPGAQQRKKDGFLQDFPFSPLFVLCINCYFLRKLVIKF